MRNTWIIVADAGRARIFCADRSGNDMHELPALSNPEARLHEGDLISDRTSRDINGGAQTAKGTAERRFAATVCDRLERGRQQHAFNRLYIMAPPHFMGLLRKHQSHALRHLISEEIPKALVTQPPQRIRAELPRSL